MGSPSQSRQGRGQLRKMTAKTLFFLVVLIPMSAQMTPDHMSRVTRATGEVEPVDKKCPQNSPCMSHKSCPVATEKFKKLTKLDRESKVMWSWPETSSYRCVTRKRRQCVVNQSLERVEKEIVCGTTRPTLMVPRYETFSPGGSS